MAGGTTIKHPIRIERLGPFHLNVALLACLSFFSAIFSAGDFIAAFSRARASRRSFFISSSPADPLGKSGVPHLGKPVAVGFGPI
jgi:hypothetical protein